MIFNSPRNLKYENFSTGKKGKYNTAQNEHDELVEIMESLGLENISNAQIEAAVKNCFPDGTENMDESDQIKQIFQYLKNNNHEHKQ